MKSLMEIYRYTFSYRWQAILTIIFNLLFVIFNLLSIVLLIPFLQMIFKTEEVKYVAKPVYKGITHIVEYVTNSYQYIMQEIAEDDPTKDPLFFLLLPFS